MCGKSHERLEDLYASSALVLTGKARKPEPGVFGTGAAGETETSAEPTTPKELPPETAVR